MISLYFNVMDKHANTIKHGQAVPLPGSCLYQFNFLSHGLVTYSCRLPLDTFVRHQAEVGFLVTFSVREYFFG